LAEYTRERVGIGVLETDVAFPMFSININKQSSINDDAIDILSLLIGQRESVVIDGFDCRVRDNKIYVSKGRCFVRDSVVTVVEDVVLTSIIGMYYICLRYKQNTVSILLMTPSRYQQFREFCVYLATIEYDGTLDVQLTYDPNLYQLLLPQQQSLSSTLPSNLVTARTTQFIPVYRVVRIVGSLVSLADCRDVGYSNCVYGMSLKDVPQNTEASFLLTGIVQNAAWNLSLDVPIVLGRDGLVTQAIESSGFYVVYLGRVISSSTIYFMPTISILRER